MLLFVDDDAATRDAVARYLQMMFDVDVETASSGKNALEMVEKGNYDAIISDFEMPGMNGLELLDELKSKKIGIPFILFTGRGREEVIVDALNKGAEGYVRKGDDPKAVFSELMHLVDSAIERRRSQEETRLAKERLESFLKYSFDAVVLFDLNGKVVDTNPSFENIYGWKREEAIGQILPMVPENEREGILEKFRLIIKTKEGLSYYGTRRGKGGRQMTMQMSISPICDSDGNVIMIAGVGRDVTDIVTAKDQLAVKAEEMRVMLSSIGDGVIATDPKGHVTFMNSTASRLTGYTEQEALGRDIREIFQIFGEITGLPATVPVEKVIAEGTVQGMANSTVLISKDGTRFVIADSASPITGVDGRLRGIILVFRDESERRRIQKRIAARRAVAEILQSKQYIEEASADLAMALSTELGMQVAEIWLHDAEKRLFTLAGEAHTAGVYATVIEAAKEIRFGSLEGLQGQVVALRENVWETDIGKSALRRKEVALAAGLKSVIAIRIKSRNEVEGAILLFSALPLDLDEALLNTLDDIGRQIALFIVEGRERRMLLTRNKVMELMKDGVVIAKGEHELKILYTNPSLREFANPDTDNLIEFAHRTYGEKFASELHRSWKEGKARSSEIIRIDRNGIVYYLDISFFPVSNDHGVEWVLLQKNVTELMEMLEMLKKANQKLNLIQSVGRHDMFNHLQAFETYLQLLPKMNEREQAEEIMQSMERVMQRIREQLKVVAEIQYSGAPRWINVRKVFEASAQGVERVGITITYTGHEVEILADPLLD
ncbi:MAG: PAS domain S-box protein, partial [Methanomassiliicoccales archaeon]